MNNIIIKGRLTRDPELKEVKVKDDIKDVCTFDVAVNKTFGEDADFFRCQIWGKRAEFVKKFFVKGQEILVQGSHESRKYEDKSGNSRIAWELKASQVEFCGSKKDNTESSSATEGFEEVDEDLPF